MRALIVATAVLAWPALAAADPTFCKSTAAVDSIVVVLVCDDVPHASYRGWPLRRTILGWEKFIDDNDRTPLTADEVTHLETWLADGVAKICKGDGDPALPFPSMHRKEYGWPMPRCHGDNQLVLGKGALTLTLRTPRVDEIAAIYKLVRLHGLGMAAVWKSQP